MKLSYINPSFVQRAFTLLLAFILVYLSGAESTYARRKLSVQDTRTVPVVKEEIAAESSESLPPPEVDKPSQSSEERPSSDISQNTSASTTSDSDSASPAESQSQPPSSAASAAASAEPALTASAASAMPDSPAHGPLSAPHSEKPSMTLAKNQKRKPDEPIILRTRVIQNEQTLITWYGHSFIYLASKSGVRIAIDPFGESVRLPFPKDLQADMALISYEAADRNGAEQLQGSPQVFRGVAGSGTHRVGGLLFKGVETWRDSSHGIKKGKNVVYIIEMDGIRFCHLGGIGDKLQTTHYEQIGHVDVLFIPVGNPLMSIDDLCQMARQLDARLIVPIAYQDAEAGTAELRAVDMFAARYKDVLRPQEKPFQLKTQNLPKKPTLLILPKS